MPIGPTPTTSARSPGRTRERRTAWAPIARNSTIAACFERQTFSRIEVRFRERDPLCHAAVAVDAEAGERGAAIGLAAAAGDAGAAGEVGEDDHRIAGLVGAPLWRLDHFGGELVAHDARVLEERVQALEDVIVGAADADAADAEKNFVGATVG